MSIVKLDMNVKKDIAMKSEKERARIVVNILKNNVARGIVPRDELDERIRKIEESQTPRIKVYLRLLRTTRE